jgi:anti-anti-sigma regulatory factor
MLKMVLTKDPGHGSTVHLEGQVIGPWVEELRRVCEPMLTNGAGLRLDLSKVSFVSREGVRVLWGLRDQHAALRNCSRFVAEQLKALEETTP